MTVDFGRTAIDYAVYRASFPEEFFSRLENMGIGLNGQRVADLGTGTGVLARGFARRGCVVTGLDPAAAMLDDTAGVRVNYLVASAEDTGLGGARWDVVSAGQRWHWFDRPRAGAEARRLLVAG